MKKLITILLLITPVILIAQVRKVNTVRTVPVKTETVTTSKRVIPPRMKTAERNRVVSPETGQTIYNINKKT